MDILAVAQLVDFRLSYLLTVGLSGAFRSRLVFRIDMISEVVIHFQAHLGGYRTMDLHQFTIHQARLHELIPGGSNE